MAITQKPHTDLDSNNAIKSSYNDVNATLSIDGFLVGLVGRQVALSQTSTTDVYTFSEGLGTTVLYVITITYTDSTKATVQTIARTA